MSIFPKSPDTWSRSLFRILLYVDIVFMLSFFMFLFEGQITQHNQDIIAHWALLCASLDRWTGLLILFCSFFWKRKPFYCFVGFVVGLLSVALSIVLGMVALQRIK